MVYSSLSLSLYTHTRVLKLIFTLSRLRVAALMTPHSYIFPCLSSKNPGSSVRHRTIVAGNAASLFCPRAQKPTRTHPAFGRHASSIPFNRELLPTCSFCFLFFMTSPFLKGPERLFHKRSLGLDYFLGQGFYVLGGGGLGMLVGVLCPQRISSVAGAVRLPRYGGC